MENNRIEQMPSQTAFFNALRRAIASHIYQVNRFGPDDLAEVFLPAYYRFFLKFKKIQINTRDKLEAAFPGLNAYIIARTSFFDRLFVNALKDKTQQVVVLGAGYDSRAFRFANLNRGTKIFELDSRLTQERKKKCLKKAKIAIPQKLRFMPIDFNQDLLSEVLEKVGFKPQQRSLFLWEGVSYYLDPDSVEVTLDNFSSLSSPDSLIAFDYMVSMKNKDLEDYYGAKAFFQSMQTAHSDEKMKFSLSEDEMVNFLEQHNLEVVEHLNPQEIETRFLCGDDGLPIDHITSIFRFVLAKPVK